QDLRLYNEEYFFRYFRMSVVQYEELLSTVAPIIQKSSQKRECIGPNERLCVTMRYLTTGDAQTTIAMNYRINPSSTGRIIYETYRALCGKSYHPSFCSVQKMKLAGNPVAIVMDLPRWHTVGGEWRSVVQRDQGLRHLTRAGSNNYSQSVKLVREDFSNYFLSWQWVATHSAEDACDINKQN
ncbi:Hypothetical predicted protein, partial [Paramuricea clavata]